MRYWVSNALGESTDMPSPSVLGEFLANIDPTDEEHGAAWVTDEFENSLEFNGDGTMVFSRGLDAAPRHIAGLSREDALTLWLLLIQGRLDELEKRPWAPGLRAPLPPEELERRQRELAEWQLDQDREFFDLLGSESSTERCRKLECSRGRITHSVFCRVHHFEDIRGRPCPFADDAEGWLTRR